MKNKKLIAGILTCSIIGGSAASLSCVAENSPEAIITSATSQAVNPSLTVIEKLTELKELCKKRLTDDISESEKRALEMKIKNIDHNIKRAQVGKEVPSSAFELPAILTKSTSKPLEEKSPKFNWKKIAIGAGVIALILGSGYAAYKFIPAVQDAINNNVLPLAQSGLDKAGNYTSSALSTTKNFAGDLYSSISKSGKNVLSLAQTGLNSAGNHVNSAFGTTKNYVGSSCSKIYDYLSNAFHFGSSGTQTSLSSADSAKVVQTAIDSNVQSSAQGLLDKVGNSTSSTFSTAKTVQAATGSNILPSAQGSLDKVVNSTSSTFSTIKSYIGSSCSKLFGTVIAACDSAIILTCLRLAKKHSDFNSSVANPTSLAATDSVDGSTADTTADEVNSDDEPSADTTNDIVPVSQQPKLKIPLGTIPALQNLHELTIAKPINLLSQPTQLSQITSVTSVNPLPPLNIATSAKPTSLAATDSVDDLNVGTHADEVNSDDESSADTTADEVGSDDESTADTTTDEVGSGSSNSPNPNNLH